MHSNNLADREEGIDKMKSLIQSQYVDKEKKRDACIKFLCAQGRGYKWREEAHVYAKGKSVDAELAACACCGFRDFNLPNLSRTFQYHHVENLPILTMTPEETKQHLNHLCYGNVELPIDDDGHWRMFNLWLAKSVWPQGRISSGEIYYHLHPELVQILEQENGHAVGSKLCEKGPTSVKIDTGFGA